MSEEGSAEGSPKLTVAEMAELAGGLAHELRNPLSTMMINLKLLAEDLRNGQADFEDTRRRALLKVDTLRREAERLQSLFDDFLSLTRPFHLERTECDLNEVVRRLVEFLEPTMRAQQIRVAMRCVKDPLRCRVDERLIGQALLNLAINAQEAMPRGGELTLATAREGRFVVITVMDRGVGIDEKNWERIMRPFFSTKAHGSGLGLSITRRIVLEHGGELSFTTHPGAGTTFSIRLPLEGQESAGKVPAG